LGDREFVLSRLTDRDLSELDEWLRARIIKMAQASLPDDASDKLFERTMGVAMSKAMRTTWMSGDGARMMATPDGMARIIWQSAHHEDPDVEYEELRRLMFVPENVKTTNEAMKSIRPRVPTSAKKGSGPNRKNSPKKRRSRRAKRTKKGSTRH